MSFQITQVDYLGPNHLFLGIDPDMHKNAFAVVNGFGEVYHLNTHSVRSNVTGRDAVLAMIQSIEHSMGTAHTIYTAAAIEAQEVAYTARDGKNPRGMVFLSAVAGACLLAAMRETEQGHCFYPAPQEWKGSVPKFIHQQRILDRLGWLCETSGSKTDGYAYPTHFGTCDPMRFADIKKSQWKHLVDAIGLALWAREKYIKIMDR